MTKNLILGPILVRLDQVWPPNFFLWFYRFWLDIVPSYHSIQFKGKLMNQTWEHDEKPTFEPSLDPQNFFVDFTSTST